MIYLDHNATAPLRKEAQDAIMDFWSSPRGNASSMHAAGRRAKEAIVKARIQVASLMGTPDPDRIVFTSGGTESDVWALKGIFADGAKANRRRLVISSVEHPAISETAKVLEGHGVEVYEIPVDRQGRLGDLGIHDQTGLVSVMRANNETGNLYDIEAIVSEARKVGALVHTDAVQAAGKVPLEVEKWGVELSSISAHKIGGPQGIGALYIHEDIEIPAMITGGGQEFGLRSGTSNAAGIIGFGAAAEAAHKGLAQNMRHTRSLRDRFEAEMQSALSDVFVLGDQPNRLPNTSLMSIHGIKGEALVTALDAQDIAISTGSACSSGSGAVSHVLGSMKLPKEDLDAVIRVSFGPESEQSELEEALKEIITTAQALRRIAEGADV
jgi:cysteine desulfurase